MREEKPDMTEQARSPAEHQDLEPPLDVLPEEQAEQAGGGSSSLDGYNTWRTNFGRTA